MICVCKSQPKCLEKKIVVVLEEALIFLLDMNMELLG